MIRKNILHFMELTDPIIQKRFTKKWTGIKELSG